MRNVIACVVAGLFGPVAYAQPNAPLPPKPGKLASDANLPARTLLQSWQETIARQKQIQAFQVEGTFRHRVTPDFKIDNHSIRSTNVQWIKKQSGNQLFIDRATDGRFEWNPLKDYETERRSIAFDGQWWYSLFKDNTEPSPEWRRKLGYTHSRKNPAPPRGDVSSAKHTLKYSGELLDATLARFPPYWFDPFEFTADSLNPKGDVRLTPASLVKDIRTLQVAGPEKILGRDAYRLDITYKSVKTLSFRPDSIWFVQENNEFLPIQLVMKPTKETNVQMRVVYTESDRSQGVWFPVKAAYTAEFFEEATQTMKTVVQDEYQWKVTRINGAFQKEEFQIRFPKYAFVVFYDGKSVQKATPLVAPQPVSPEGILLVVSLLILAVGLALVFRRKEQRHV